MRWHERPGAAWKQRCLLWCMFCFLNSAGSSYPLTLAISIYNISGYSQICLFSCKYSVHLNIWIIQCKSGHFINVAQKKSQIRNQLRRSCNVDRVQRRLSLDPGQEWYGLRPLGGQESSEKERHLHTHQIKFKLHFRYLKKPHFTYLKGSLCRNSN